MIDKNKNFVLKIELGIFFEEMVFKYINNVFPEDICFFVCVRDVCQILNHFRQNVIVIILCNFDCDFFRQVLLSLKLAADL